MSDPLTNVDAEDVLVSIRRLIAQDADNEWTVETVPVAREGAGQHSQPSADDKESRFLLTPALRVVGADTQRKETPATDAALGRTALSLDPYLVSKSEDGAGENAPSPNESLAELVENQIRHATMEATIAELEAAISQNDDEFEPDEGEPEPSTPLWFQSYAKAERALYANLGNAPSTSGLHGQAHDDAPLTADRIASGNTEVEPQPKSVEFNAAHTSVATSEPNQLVLDEDALRDLVLDMVRSELKGALGERITRNVRKLVRREIYRVMSEQGLIE